MLNAKEQSHFHPAGISTRLIESLVTDREWSSRIWHSSYGTNKYILYFYTIYIYSFRTMRVCCMACQKLTKEKRRKRNDERIDLNKSHAFMHEQSILSTLCIYAMYDNVLLRTEGEPQKEKKKKEVHEHTGARTHWFFFRILYHFTQNRNPEILHTHNTQKT